jgi:putative oxidoreductase
MSLETLWVVSQKRNVGVGFAFQPKTVPTRTYFQSTPSRMFIYCPFAILFGTLLMSWMQKLLASLNEWEWVGILLARLAVGLLFVLSGGGKLSRSDRREIMRQTLREAGIPFPHLNAVAVSVVEFVFGALLVIGALTPLSCVMLGAVMIGAIATTQIRSIKSTSPIDWLSEFLYLPEVLYLVILVWLFLSGPGWLSADHLILSRTTL